MVDGWHKLPLNKVAIKQIKFQKRNNNVFNVIILYQHTRTDSWPMNIPFSSTISIANLTSLPFLLFSDPHLNLPTLTRSIQK